MKITVACLLLAAMAASSQAIRFVCYFPNWTIYRSGLGTYSTSNIDPFKCTHLIYAFAVLDANTYKIKVYDPWADIDPTNANGQQYSKFVALKQENPSLKTMIAIGGWTDSTSGPKYSNLVASTANINTFVSSVVAFLQLYQFDGLDIDWEYPATAADKAGFVQLLSALRTAFGSTYLLSVAVGAGAGTVNAGYDIPSISNYVDFYNLMEYDMHGSSWEPSKADHHAPLFRRSWDTDPTFTVNGSVSYWISQGAPASKLNMGIPLYGQSWTLTSSTVAPPAPANGPGTGGAYTQQAGFLGYYEICNNIKANGWVQANDPLGLNGPCAYSLSSKQWVGFDDVAMVTTKTNYAVAKGLGGVMVWDISTDDFQNSCGGGKNPLISAISAAASAGATTVAATTSATTAASATTTTTSKAPSTITTTKTTTTTMTSTTTASSFTCPQPNGLFANPTDCSSFYNCGHSVAYLQYCSSGLYFNPKLQYCDWASNVVCTATTASANTTTTTTTASATTKSSSFTCPQPNGLFANSGDCSSFYNCGHSIAYLQYCSSGLYFNPERQYCDWPSNVVCNLG